MLHRSEQRLLIAVLICGLLGPGLGSLHARTPGPLEWSTYKGAWFEIKYPAEFTPRPSLKSISSDDKFDSAFFTAADGSVEFYVFAPQWNGTPSDIELDDFKESPLSRDEQKTGDVIIRRVTVAARDSSYIRAFEETENVKLNIKRVFGIRYRDQKAYDKYRQMYLKFKSSLRQSSD